MEKANFNLRVKAIDETGKFTGIGAVYNNVDLGGDRILPGAFTKTLEAGKQLPLLWQHNPSDPIGTVKVTDSAQGLMVEGQLLLSDPTAAKAYSFLKAGIIKGLSIGYDTIKAAFVDEVRELKELKLWELSVVTFPMNESAFVTGIKAMSDDDRAKHFKAIDTHRKAIDKHQRAIRESLKCLFDGIDDDPGDEDDDPELLESESDGEMSMIIAEMKALTEQANELASA
jgi:hypothetical protein